MSRLIVVVVLLGAFIFIGYHMVSFLFAINSTKSQKRRDVGNLRDSIRPLIEGLVKLNSEELELLSINQVDTGTKLGINTVRTGVFTSIYQEPLIAYARKTYGQSGTEVLTVLHTSEQSFVYESSGSKTRVSVDDQQIGTIHSDGNLYDMKDRQVAHIEADDVLSTHPVKIGNREVGEIVNPMLAASPNPRAYTFLEPMDTDEQVLFMALTLLSLVEESV